MKTKLTAVLLALCAVIPLCFTGCDLNAVQISYKKVDGGYAVSGYTDKTTVTRLEIPPEIDGVPVVEIADFGICNAESLLTIRIGKNVRTIGTWALTNNQHLQAFEVDPENEYFTAVDGVLFTKDMETLCFYPNGRGVTFDKFGQTEDCAEYKIPDGVKTVRSKAFYKCYYVNVTYFPDSVEDIQEKAFHRTNSQKNFTMPANLRHIGKDAFSYNENFTELTIGSAITAIDDFAFFCCKNMTKLTIEAKKDELTLGSKWEPSDKGKVLKDCEIVFTG